MEVILNDVFQKEMFKTVIEQKGFIRLTPEEPKTLQQDVQWKNTGYCVMNGTTQENWKLILKTQTANGV